MRYSVCKFVAIAAALAGAASSQQMASANFTTPLWTEVDVVFPGNETYKRTEIIPIILAVQNLPTWMLNDAAVKWVWEITPYFSGEFASDLPYDRGVFEVLPTDSPAKDPTFLIAVTNVTRWYQTLNGAKAWGEKNMLVWAATWYNANGSCLADLPSNFEAVMFDVELSDNNEWSARYNYTNGIPADIPLAPKCPIFNNVAQITLNPTATSCEPRTRVPAATAQGNPCAVTINEAVATSLSSRVASLSARVYATSTTVAVIPTSRSRGGADAARTLPTALAAAGVFCGLAFV